jgi:hypothetical protein
MNIRSLKLYHYPATRSARVKWLLHELIGDDFEIQRLDLYDGAQYEPEYLKINPNHNVFWGTGYGMCRHPVFQRYVGTLSQRPAFLKAFSDVADFSPVVPEDKKLAIRFTG